MYNEKEIHPLAHELAEALNDTESLIYYQGLVERFNEEKLKDTLRRVLSIPAEKIRRSRAAYFNYLMQQSHFHGNDYSRN